MYSLLYRDKYKNTCKGIQRCVAKNKITFDDYYNTLISGKCMRHTVKRILSRKHNISLIQQNKVSLSAYDDKRYILDDGITTLAYGNYKIKNLWKTLKGGSLDFWFKLKAFKQMIIYNVIVDYGN